MKDFARDNLLFSLCGLNCGLCPMNLGGYCPGCGGGAGNQACAIARCSLNHGGVKYCFLCVEYPCSQYENITEYDSFITHRNQLTDIQKAQEIGVEAYTEEQQEKVEILRLLLAEYNDGRRKMYYSVFVNLMDLPDLRILMDQIKGNAIIQTMDMKEKAAHVVDLCKRLAENQGIDISLRKKKKNS
jgi:hypothetical protein